VAASPRLVSQPNATGSRRAGRSRICFIASPKTAGGTLAARASVLPVSPGGKLSNASREASITLPARGAPGDEQLGDRAAGVVADQGDIF
jgi:hypothetical protein